MRTKTNVIVMVGLGLLLGGCGKPSEPVAPAAKAPKKAMTTVATPSEPAIAPVAPPPPGVPAAAAPSAAPSTAPKVIVPGSADDPNVMPPGFVPKPIPRQYVVNGQVDLNALSEALRDYCMWKKSVPGELNELVTSKYLPSLPEPPAGKKYAIDKSQLSVTLVNK